MKVYGFVFARGGSKGVPGKNIKEIAGKPLIAWAIEAGLQCGGLEKIIVSTDSPEIAAVARHYGAETPFLRPPELASDTAPEGLAWRHAVNFCQAHGDEFDVFVSLPATAPLKTPAQILACLNLYRQGGCDAVITCREASRSPYFNMVELDKAGYAHLIIPSCGEPVARRQDARPVFDMTTIAYVTSPEFILTERNLFEGKVKTLLVDKVSAIDIDDPVDFEIAEYFLLKRARAGV